MKSAYGRQSKTIKSSVVRNSSEKINCIGCVGDDVTLYQKKDSCD